MDSWNIAIRKGKSGLWLNRDKHGVTVAALLVGGLLYLSLSLTPLYKRLARVAILPDMSPTSSHSQTPWHMV